MAYVVRYQDDDGEQLEDTPSLDHALARLQELHEAGNPTGRVYRELAVRVQTVVHVSVDEPTEAPAPAVAPVEVEPEASPEPVEVDETTVADVAAEHALTGEHEEHPEPEAEQAPAPVELPPLPAFFDEPDDAPPAPPAPAPAPRRAVTAVEFVARSS